MYYVTLCVKTETATKAIQWFNNAEFGTLAAAQNYRDSLLNIVDSINNSPPNPKRIPNIEGERILVITQNPAPDIKYLSKGTAIESKTQDVLKDDKDIQKPKKNIPHAKRKTKKVTEYVRLYHGPIVKKSTANWLERKDANASRLLLGIIGFMVLAALLSECM